MRALRYLSVAAALAALPFSDVRSQTTDPNAILAAAREALGGDKRLSSIKTFILSGRTRQVRGDNLVPIEFEISCELPDKFVRKDEIPAQESGPTTVGFNGTELIQVPSLAGQPSRAGGQPPTPGQLEAVRRGRIESIKQDFARLSLGMFASSFSAYPLEFAYVGQAEAPQGMADVLEAPTDSATIARVAAVVKELTARFPVYAEGKG